MRKENEFIFNSAESHRGFPGGLVVNNPLAMQEMWVPSLGQENPLEKEMATQLQRSLLGNPVDSRARCAPVHSVTESDTT